MKFFFLKEPLLRVALALARSTVEVLTPSTKDLFLSARKSYICNYPLHKKVRKRIFEPAD